MEWYIRVAWWVISTMFIKKYETFVNNPPVKRYIKKKIELHLKLRLEIILTLWTINLLGNTEN